MAKKVFTQKVDSKELQVDSKRTFTFLKKGKGANCSTFKLGKAQLSEKVFWPECLGQKGEKI